MITRYKAVQPQEFTVVMKLVSGEFFHIHCYGLGLQLQSGIRIAIAFQLHALSAASTGLVSDDLKTDLIGQVKRMQVVFLYGRQAKRQTRIN